MKKAIAIILASVFAFSACGRYDDLEERVYDLESRIHSLERMCSQMNTNISALQAAVNVLDSGDCITSVNPVYQEREVVGYTISFLHNSPITIYNGKNTAVAPVIGIRKDADGAYCWTMDGEWITATDGSRVRAEGKNGAVPQLKIEEGNWYMSVDGVSWTKIGMASSAEGVSVFLGVDYDNDFVYLTMADGTRLSLPRFGSSIKSTLLTVQRADWLYTNVNNNNYFSFSFPLPEITGDVFDNGVVKVYRVFDFDTNDAVQMELPYIRHHEYNQGDDWFFYTETVDCEIGIGKVSVFYTESDFNYEIDEAFIPETMQFRCVIME